MSIFNLLFFLVYSMYHYPHLILCFLLVQLQSRGAAAREVLAKLGSGAVFMSSANDSNIIAGQGTIAVELLEQVGIRAECILHYNIIIMLLLLVHRRLTGNKVKCMK